MERTIDICVIDDERIVCERLQPVLEKKGFYVETYTDSKKARERISEKKFDIIITDIKMSPLNGIELLKFARSQSPETRVIIITGFATVDMARAAMKGGAVDFIAKPFRLSQLSDLVARIAAEIQNGSAATPPDKGNQEDVP